MRARLLAPAKVNLFLRVYGKRPDGFHEIDTLFQAVDLCDEVEVELGGEGVTLDVDGPDLGPTEDNLAYRAAQVFLEDVGVGDGRGPGVHVRLTKRVPVGAGLGGGSSDGASVLRCLAELVGGVEADRLHRLGAGLGADVSFFLGASPLARGRGRGEALEALPALPPGAMVLVSPPVRVSTAGAYAALSEVRAGRVPEPEDPWAGPPETWEDARAVAVNDFEPVISAAHPEVGRALQGLQDAGASWAMMTGSGSTCFGLFDGPGAAEGAAESLRARLGWPCHATSTLAAFPAAETGS